MRIDRTEFGEITIDGKTYEHDVILRLSGEVVKRKKKLPRALRVCLSTSARIKSSTSSLRYDLTITALNKMANQLIMQHGRRDAAKFAR